MKLGRNLILATALIAAGACGDDEESTTETPAAEAVPATQSAAEAPEPQAEEPAAAEAPAPGERVDATFENHFPTQLAQVATAPTGDETLEAGLVKITALEGTSMQRTQGGEGEHYTIAGGPGELGAYAHNPAGDGGEDCPSIESIREGLANAQIEEERRLASPWSGEGPAYGDEIDLLLFGQGEQAGFYLRKRFDHGDDYTDFCVATGTPQAPAANVTPEQARALAGAFLTAREEL